jgi:hypothetical protein
MKIVVFLGPTLPLVQAREHLDATFLPPAARGDVYRAAQSRPKIIALIDGYFSSVPSVRHKEILWAMSEGIHVFGAASMGALRAAELAQFGMVGVGDVFLSYSSGALEDDDEVAVLHGPGDLGYRAASEALVNIRATLEKAVSSSIIDSALCSRLLRLAKQMHYADRSYSSLIEHARSAQIENAALDRLADWLPANRLDLKSADAMALLSTLSRFAATDPAPFEPKYFFNRTEAWDQLTLDSGSVSTSESDVTRDDLLDEVRLVPGLYQRVSEAALARGLALREADRQGVVLDAKRLRELIAAWPTRYGLENMEALTQWMAANCLDETGLNAFVAEEERRRRLSQIAEPLRERHLLNALRATGDFARLFIRARNKKRACNEGNGDAVAAAYSVEQLVSWFAVRRLGHSQMIDATQLAAGLGFPNVLSLDRALRREYHYVQQNKQ